LHRATRDLHRVDHTLLQQAAELARKHIVAVGRAAARLLVPL
jgi:hypothetical protein